MRTNHLFRSSAVALRRYREALPFLFLGAVILLPLTSFCAVHYHDRYVAASGSEDWPSVEGIVIESKVVHSRDYDDSRITYEYTVNGETFTAHRIEFGHSTLGSLGNARTDVENYPSGKRVTVYYKPGNPATATLIPGNSTARFMFYWSAGFVALSAVTLLTSTALSWPVLKRMRARAIRAPQRHQLE